MNTQMIDSDGNVLLSYDDLNPLLPPPRSENEARLHWLTKQTIATMPRSTLGLAILRALGMKMPARPRSPVSEQALRESGERIRAMQADLAAKGLTPTGREKSQPEIQQLPSKVEELRDSVSRGEAQTNFEAMLRGRAVRESFKA